MKNIKIITLLLFAVYACSPNEEYKDFEGNVEYSTVVASGDWFVEAFVGDALVANYFLLTTSNTSENDGTEIQIFDHSNFYWFNAKCPINIDGLTFSGTDLPSSVLDEDTDTYYNINITISNGLIVKNNFTAPSGTTTDSISFDVVFSDDPSATVYTLVGYKSTKFLEDLH